MMGIELFYCLLATFYLLSKKRKDRERDHRKNDKRHDDVPREMYFFLCFVIEFDMIN